MTTTKLSLDYLRKQGMIAAVVEHWMSFPEVKNGKPTGKTIRMRRDLWNCGDILAFWPDRPGVLIVQTTTTAHQAERIAKACAIREAGEWLKQPDRHIEVHGWKQNKTTRRWEVTVTELEPTGPVVVSGETKFPKDTPLFDEMF